MTNLIGQSLGRYHILEQLGEGGMAVVYKAYDTHLEIDVAVKVIRIERLTLETIEKTRKRFEREAKALASLNHPNIVKILDYGKDKERPYLVMPFLSGGTLKKRLSKPIPWLDAVKVLLPIARALSYAHQQGVLHRDIKPSNILITQAGDPLLSDFGIARILDNEETMDLTGTGFGIGTPEYMAPEQFQSSRVDDRAEVYALGTVLYEMIAGRKPYQADTPAAIMIKQATEPLPRPKQFVRELPDEVEKILLKALAKQPANRYQSMSEFAFALERAQLKPGLKTKIEIPANRIKDGYERTMGQAKSGKRELKPNYWNMVGLGAAGLIVILFLGWMGFSFLNPDHTFAQPIIPEVPITLSANPLLTSSPLIQATLDIAPDPANTVSPVSATLATDTMTPLPIQVNQDRLIYISGNPGNWNINELSESGIHNSVGTSTSPVPYMEISPGQDKVAYLSQTNNNTVIFVKDLKSGNTHELPIGDVSNAQLSKINLIWSPNGLRLYVSEMNLIYDLSQDTSLILDVVMSNVSWSPDGKRIAGKTAKDTVYTYDVDSGVGKRFSVHAFGWLGNEHLLTVTLIDSETILLVDNINVSDDSRQQIIRTGIKRGCACGGGLWDIDWDISVSASGDKAIIHRNRQPYYDFLWLDLSSGELVSFYKSGKILLWAGWTSDSLGLFLKSTENDESLDGFPGVMLSANEINKDNSNVLSYTLSPNARKIAFLACRDRDPAAQTARCTIQVIDVDSNVASQITTTEQVFQLGAGLTWSPNNLSLAYVIEDNNVYQLTTVKIGDEPQSRMTGIVGDASIFWIK